ncbi:MAG TPA: PAS domain S-box protein, partial [Candidatus Wallbacteria bacterium]|nr:PAS domain S-box protein [Candidatus Wallbacteria bacterium]
GMCFNDPGTLKTARDGIPCEHFYRRDMNNPASPFHGEEIIDILLPAYDRGHNHIGAVNVGLSLKRVSEMKNKYYFLVLCAIMVMTVIIMGITLNVFNNIILPIEKIAQAMRGTGEGNMSRLDAVARNDEIGVLSGSFNAMTEKIGGLVEDLKERERDLQQYMDRLLTFCAKLSTDGSIILINTAMAAGAGIDRAELIGRKFWDLPHWRISSETRRKLEETIKEAAAGASSKYEVINSMHGDNYAILELIIRPVFSAESKNVEYIVAEAMNITERKRAENDLIESEAKSKKELEFKINMRTMELRAANDKLKAEIAEKAAMQHGIDEHEARHKALSEALFDVSCETDPTGKYIYVSPNNEKLVGFKPEEMVGRYFHEFVHPDDIPIAAEAFEKGLRDIKLVVEIRFRHKDPGRFVWIESTGQKYFTSSGELRAIIVSRDITERKKMEDDLLKSSKIEALSTLAGGIAHDFNNVLMGIIGNITLAKKRVTGDEKTHEILTRAEKVIYKAKWLTEQLTTFSQGGLPIKKLININVILKDTVQFASAGGNVTCAFSFDEKLPPVEADEGQFAQVITNLVINAKQSMPGGGLIKISTSLHHAADGGRPPLKKGEYVKIAIKDSGDGIPVENLKKIFDPYFTTKANGTGLGLATSYSIIKNHDGHIDVDSEPGKGAVFSVYLPVKNTAALSSETRKKFSENYGNKKILLMDDDETVLIPVCEMLADFGYEVMPAKSGEEAVDLYSKAKKSSRPFDIVIMDLIVQGGAGGVETIKMLLKMDPDTIAIVSSGYSNDPVMSDHESYGFKGVIAKPYKDEEMLQLLEKLFRERDKNKG